MGQPRFAGGDLRDNNSQPSAASLIQRAKALIATTTNEVAVFVARGPKSWHAVAHSFRRAVHPPFSVLFGSVTNSGRVQTHFGACTGAFDSKTGAASFHREVRFCPPPGGRWPFGAAPGSIVVRMLGEA